MLAAVYHGPEDIRLEERPVPEIGADEALLKVISAGICGTDLRIYKGGHRHYPAGTVRIPGHEVVGEIAAVGEGLSGVEIAQRVMIAPNFATGMCPQAIRGDNNLCPDFGAIGITLDGAFAEYMRIPGALIRQGNLIPIRRDTDPAAAALIEPFACVLRGQKPLRITPSDVVLVMGAGPIGVMHVMLARLQGARRVIVSEVQPARLPAATEAGADRVVNPLEEDLHTVVMEESGGQGADAIIVAAPAHQAQEESLKLAAIGGRINFFGGLPKDRPTIQFDSNLVHYKELIVTGTTACSTADCWQAAEIVNAGRVNLQRLVSRRFPLSQVNEAFQAAQESLSLKIVLEP
jgi:L-iditol 2-dehydrogenase